MVSFSRSGRASTELLEAPGDQPQDQDTQQAPVAPVPVQVAASSAAFPSVNLIPDEIAEEAKTRRAKIILAGATLASVAAVGALFLMAGGEVSAAQDELDAANARGVELTAQAAQYSDVPKVRADLESAQQQQYLAMGAEVRWSFLLNNLALTIPRATSLTSFKATINGTAPTTAAAGAAATTSAAGTTSPLGNVGVGRIEYAGEAKSYDGIAAFIDALAKQPTLLDPYVTTAAKDDGAQGAVSTGTVDVPGQGLKFASSANVADKALSHRYDLKASE